MFEPPSDCCPSATATESASPEPVIWALAFVFADPPFDVFPPATAVADPGPFYWALAAAEESPPDWSPTMTAVAVPPPVAWAFVYVERPEPYDDWFDDWSVLDWDD